MPPEESGYPRDWLRIAEKDLRRVRQLLNLSDAEAAGFYLQQGVEKLLKAFLLSRGWKLRRIHDLEALLNEAIRHDPPLERFRDVCQRITTFYMLDRYPLVAEAGLTPDDVAEALDGVYELTERLRGHLPGAPG